MGRPTKKDKREIDGFMDFDFIIKILRIINELNRQFHLKTFSSFLSLPLKEADIFFYRRRKLYNMKMISYLLCLPY
jgi:hypothetical protein